MFHDFTCEFIITFACIYIFSEGVETSENIFWSGIMNFPSFERRDFLVLQAHWNVFNSEKFFFAPSKHNAYSSAEIDKVSLGFLINCAIEIIFTSRSDKIVRMSFVFYSKLIRIVCWKVFLSNILVILFVMNMMLLKLLFWMKDYTHLFKNGISRVMKK